MPDLTATMDYPSDRPRRRRYSGEIAFAVLLCVAVGFLSRVESGWQVLAALILALYGFGSLWEPFPRKGRKKNPEKSGSAQEDPRPLWPPQIGALHVRLAFVAIGLFASSLPHWLSVGRSWGVGAFLGLTGGIIGRYWLARFQVLETRNEPGFWKRVGRSNRLFPRKLKFTKEGKILIGITLGIGFAAINTGNNLMYLVLGMLLSLMVVSGILSELSLRGVVVERVRRGPGEAGREEYFGYTVLNTKSFFVSYCLEVEEVLDLGTIVSGYVLRLPPDERRTVRASLRVNHRGVHPSAGISLSTRFPFSMFRKSRFFTVSLDVVMTPTIRPVKSIQDKSYREGVEEALRKVGRGEDVYGLKEYRPGDPMKDIHWKVTAKRGQLMAREYEAPGNRIVWLVFLERLREERDHDEYERALQYIASLADAFWQSGASVGLLTHAGEVAPGAGDRHREDFLVHLARLDGRSTSLEWESTGPRGGLKIQVALDGTARYPFEADEVHHAVFEEDAA